MSERRPALAAAIVLSFALVTACTSSTSTSGSTRAGAIAVTAGEKSCDVADTSLLAGRHVFEVTNTAAQVTEVYVYAAGDRIVGEVENVGPATKRNLIVDLPGGRYEVACKPGMIGAGNRTAVQVTGAAAPARTPDQQLTAAVADYRRYVRSETAALVSTTGSFVAAIGSGSLARARQAYPAARLHYERIEPVAESFGALDPLIDMRADDATGGAPFVGFHAIEQQLFQRRSVAGAAALAGPLVAHVAKLDRLVATVRFTPLIMGNGAKSLLDEVARSKVTGEEERYSRIDLVDFAGNVDGAENVFTALRPALLTKDPALVATLDTRFRTLQALLNTHRATAATPGYVAGSPYVSYDVLTAEQIKALAVEVDAISEPLGRISGVVTGR